MAAYYLFFRCWPGFSEPFPFDRFNSLPDDELVKALDAYARGQVGAEKARIKSIRRERKRKLGRRPLQNPVPWQPSNKAQRGHYDYRVRGAFRRDPLVCRVGAYLGWWNSADASSAGVAAGRVHGWFVGPQVWMLEADDQALAEHLVVELNDKQILDLHRYKAVYLWTSNPRFGCVPSESFSTAERTSIQRQINAIGDGKQPGVGYGEASLLIGQRARQVATDVAEAWAQVTSGKTEATNQQKLEETAPADGTGKGGVPEELAGKAEKSKKQSQGGRRPKWDKLWEVIQEADKEDPKPSNRTIASRYNQRCSVPVSDPKRRATAKTVSQVRYDRTKR